MDNIKVSIIILSYNHQDYIRKAIDSVLMQEVSFSIEIIIADDCSLDHTQEILKEYQKYNPQKIRLLLQNENSGTTKNICDAFVRCNGDYITCLAGDDYWIDPQKLQTQFDFLEDHNDYIGVSHIVESRDDEGIILGKYPTSRVIGQDATIDLFLNGVSFSTGSTMFRNIFKHERAGDYINLITANRLVEDFPLALILLDVGKVFVMDRCMSVYRTGKREGATNYNTVTNQTQKLLDNISLCVNAEKFFVNKYDFSKLKAKVLKDSFANSINENKIIQYFSQFRCVSFRVKLELFFFILHRVYKFLNKKVIKLLSNL